jgi:hypothetical protein
MPRGLHTFLRILVPGAIVLVETLLLYVFTFRPSPGDSDVWAFMSAEWGKTTGFAVLAIVLGWAYYAFEVTHRIDAITFNGMNDVRANIVARLLRPFHSDPELAPKLDRLEWRALKRIFFNFVDELPGLKTSNELAFLSGLVFYSFLDLATISSFEGALASAAWWSQGSGSSLALRIYTVVLVAIIPISALAARTAIRKHKETSDRQIDAVLSDHLTELRGRLLRSVTVY